MAKSRTSKTSNSLEKSIKGLNASIKELTNLFKRAAEEPSADELELKKLDTLIGHNEDLAKAMLLLLEVNRENLPRIAEELKERQATPKQIVKPIVQPTLTMPAPQPKPQSPLRPRQEPQPSLTTDFDLELPSFEEDVKEQKPKRKGLF